jgi:hypothetical protein
VTVAEIVRAKQLLNADQIRIAEAIDRIWDFSIFEPIACGPSSFTDGDDARIVHEYLRDDDFGIEPVRLWLR